MKPASGTSNVTSVTTVTAGARRAMRGLALALLAGLAACRWGTTPSKMQRLMPAAGGIEVAIGVPGQGWPLRGELYAVDTVGALVRADKLTLVHWTSMRYMDVVGFGLEFDMPAGAGMNDARRERIRLLSRFPQGLHGTLLTEVLKSLGQDSVLVLVPIRR